MGSCGVSGSRRWRTFPGVPDLSVVIATLRRPAVLRRTLSRLEQQTVHPATFEVLVVSDAAEPDLEAVKSAIGTRTYEVRHLVGSTPGVSATRNTGWRAAAAPLVLFIGDDMLPTPGLVAEHQKAHASDPDPDAAVLGFVRWAPELRITPFMRWLEHGIQFDYPSIRGEAAWWHLYTANASLKRSRLEEVGGFDEDFRFGYEELDLAKRLDEVGLRVIYRPAAVVEHLHAATIEDWRQRMRVVAAAERQFVKKHPGTEPYFLQMFEAALDRPPARGRAARLVGRVPRGFPLLGGRVWGSADAYFTQQLAPAFLEAWRSDEPASSA